MNNVTRWRAAGSGVMLPAPAGPFVHYNDYAALQAKLREAERDAARYRWLLEGENASIRLNHLPPDGTDWPETLSAAIDAAITGAAAP